MDLKNIKNKIWYVVFASLFLIYVVGAINSDNINETLSELQRKISILVFPFVLLVTPTIQKEKFKYILLGFVVACFAIAVICLVGALHHFLVYGDSFYFFYHALSSIVGMSAIYLSMYFNCSIIILLTFFKFSKNKLFYSIFCLLLFSIMIFLLSSRTQIIIFIIIFMLYSFIYLRNIFGYVKSTMISIFICFLVFMMVLLIPNNRERFKQAINYNNEYKLSGKWGDQQIRYLIWDSSLQLISTNFFTGVGTGDVQDELQSTYLNNKYTSLTYLPNVQFNAHNQFLEIGVELGIGGMITLLLVLLVPLWYAFKNKNILYAIFLLIFFTSCLTESMLERQNGIVFYAFFNSLLFSYNINSKN